MAHVSVWTASVGSIIIHLNTTDHSAQVTKHMYLFYVA
jgi:hypothetical protein